MASASSERNAGTSTTPRRRRQTTRWGRQAHQPWRLSRGSRRQSQHASRASTRVKCTARAGRQKRAVGRPKTRALTSRSTESTTKVGLRPAVLAQFWDQKYLKLLTTWLHPVGGVDRGLQNKCRSPVFTTMLAFHGRTRPISGRV